MTGGTVVPVAEGKVPAGQALVQCKDAASPPTAWWVGEAYAWELPSRRAVSRGEVGLERDSRMAVLDEHLLETERRRLRGCCRG